MPVPAELCNEKFESSAQAMPCLELGIIKVRNSLDRFQKYVFVVIIIGVSSLLVQQYPIQITI